MRIRFATGSYVSNGAFAAQGRSFGLEEPFFLYPWGRDFTSSFSLHKHEGFLVHEVCLETLKQVQRETVSAQRPLSLRELLLVLKLNKAELDSRDFDWGYGDSFATEVLGRWGIDESWNPVEDSEVCPHIFQHGLRLQLTERKWTVMDPTASIDLTPLIAKASKAFKSGYEFAFPPDKDPLGSKYTSDVLSTIPPELRMRILQMLPTDSVMNLFLASPAFRRLAHDLSPAFWKSRLFFDVPWCADMALDQLAAEQDRRVPFDRLYHRLREASTCDAWEADEKDEEDEDVFNKSSMGLRNRRHIWLNCERTLKAIESRHAAVRNQAGSSSPAMSQLTTTSKVVSISTEARSDTRRVHGS